MIAAGQPNLDESARGSPPEITRRWTRSALLEHRVAFEEEMARRRRELDGEFRRFWRARNA